MLAPPPPLPSPRRRPRRTGVRLARRRARALLSMWLGSCLAASLYLGCAPSLGHGYRSARSAAERAYAHGRYEESAEHWERAAAEAARPKDREEAIHRRAAALTRAGRGRQADLLLAGLVAQRPDGPRAARALYDRALLARSSGRDEAADELLDEVVRKHPDSAIAPLALRRRLQAVERSHPEQLLALLRTLREPLANTELDEPIRYAIAQRTEHEGDLAAARKLYEEVARRHPYPEGALWDDALWHAARLDERLGEPEAAIRRLRFMLSHLESSHLQGSYRRKRFAEAQCRIAEIYRDALADPARAREEFGKVWADHETSLLRDDAKWQQAKLARVMGDESAACSALELITEQAPDSRFTGCAPLLCSRLESPTGRSCRRYLRRELEATPGLSIDATR